MLVITAGLSKLEEIFGDIKIHKKSYDTKFIYEEMFEEEEYYQKAIKYYYGMFDKLCQKTQTSWNEQIVQRVWSISEKIWNLINQSLP